MATFEFLVDQLPFGYAFNFDNYLFNKIKHINTQGVDSRADFFIVNNIKKRIEGKIHFLIQDGTAYSPFKSLFGSFEFNPRIHPNLIFEFWNFIEEDLIKRGISLVKITNFASCYAPRKAEIIKNSLEKAGFTIPLKAVNHHIPVKNEPLQARMHAMQVRRLKKCRNAGFVFAEEPAQNTGEIYDYVQECRREQGLELSIAKEKIMDYLELFPANYPAFTVRKAGEIMAATITIRTHRKILYSFLPGSLRKNKAYSPTVMLNEGLYRWCQDRGIEMFDLGISTEKDGTDQTSLIAFKERLGGERSYKYFFEKKL